MDGSRIAYFAPPPLRYVTRNDKTKLMVVVMVKQGAIALLGPVLMLTGCIAAVGAAVSGFGDRLIASDATLPVSAVVAEDAAQ